MTSGIAATYTPGSQAQTVGFPSDSSAVSASSAAVPANTKSFMSQLLEGQGQAQQGGNLQNSPVPNFQALMAQQQQQQQQSGLRTDGNLCNLPMLLKNLLGGSLQANNASPPAAPPVPNGWSSAFNSGPVTSQGQGSQDALALLLQTYSKQQQQQPQPQPHVLPAQPQQPPALPPGTDATTVAGIQQLLQVLSSDNASSGIAAIAALLAAAALSKQSAQPVTQQNAFAPQGKQEVGTRTSRVKSTSSNRHGSSSGSKKPPVAQKKKKAKTAKSSLAKPSASTSFAAVARSSMTPAAVAANVTTTSGASTEKKKKVTHMVTGKEKEDVDWGKPGVDYTCYPCPARSVAATDHYRIGVLRIPKNVRHSQELLCTHPACRSKGVRFLYCSFCEQPVAKANFGTR